MVKLVQKERSAHESILSNLSQYGLGSHYLDVAVVDCARTAWRRAPLLDAIITDPPYGIREATARVGRDTSGDDCELTAQQKKQRRKNHVQHRQTSASKDQLNGEILDTALANVQCDGRESTNGLQVRDLLKLLLSSGVQFIVLVFAHT
ncbi:DNA methylase N-6 adenine-specific conserved site [Trinorchestia longiramus]|nr:DNA methylase N-6 adenine-specific conserved site [Trinorchestia longiramus]